MGHKYNQTYKYSRIWHKENCLPGTAKETKTILTKEEIELISTILPERNVKKEYWPIKPGTKIEKSWLVVDYCFECEEQIRVLDVKNYNLCLSCRRTSASMINYNCSSSNYPLDEISPWQENAIRILEECGDYLMAGSADFTQIHEEELEHHHHEQP